MNKLVTTISCHEPVEPQFIPKIISSPKTLSWITAQREALGPSQVMPGFCGYETSVGGSITIQTAEVPHQWGCRWASRRKAAMCSQHFHLTTNKDQAHEIWIPTWVGEGMRFYFPNHSIQSTQQHGQTISTNGFEQNTQSDRCCKPTTQGHTKGRPRRGAILGRRACFKILIPISFWRNCSFHCTGF